MNQKLRSKLDSARKWLEKGSNSALNLKPAQAALAEAEKAAAAYDKVKAQFVEASAARAASLERLEASMDALKLEKKLKKKQHQIENRLASLSSSN